MIIRVGDIIKYANSICNPYLVLEIEVRTGLPCRVYSPGADQTFSTENPWPRPMLLATNPTRLEKIIYGV